LSASVQTVSIPFIDALPKEPTIALKSAASFIEDAGVNLDSLIEIVPAAGRSLESHSVLVKLPNNYAVSYSNGLTTTTVTDTVTVNGQVYSVLPLQGRELNDYLITTPLHSKASISDIAILVRDSTFTRMADSEVLAPVISISAAADGVNPTTLDNRNPATTLEVGTATVVHTPSDTLSIFSGIALVDSAETFVAKLVFKSTAANAVAVKLGDSFVLPQTSGADLAYSFTQAELAANTVSVIAKAGLFGKSAEIQALTVDGTNISAVRTEPLVLTITATGQAPSASAASAAGTEDTAITVPINITINEDRVAFEKVGFTVTTTNSALQSGKFSASAQDSASVQEFTYSDGNWNLFNPTNQIDFSTLKFTPPTNFSGSAGFTFRSYSKINDVVTPSPTSSSITVDVEAAAESISFSTPVASLTGTEDALPIAFPIAGYFSRTGFETGSGILGDEKVAIEITLPSSVALQKLVSGTTYSSLVPTSTVTNSATYLVSVNQKTFESDLAGYRLLPASNYNSPTSAGSTITIKATSFEPTNGAVGTPSTTTLNLVITPDADTPSAPLVVRSAVTIDESQLAPSTFAWLQATDAVRLPTAGSVLGSGETLSVVITASNKLVLATKSGNNYSELSGGESGSNVTYVLTPAQYATLYIRGDEYESGSASFAVTLRATEIWGAVAPDTADSSSATATFTLQAKASGADGPGLSAHTTAEDSSGVALYSPTRPEDGFVLTPAALRDGSETLNYLVTVPTGAHLVATN
jgi:hypothetical protein